MWLISDDNSIGIHIKPTSRQIESVFKILKKKKLLYKGTLDKPKGNSNSEWEQREQLLFSSSKFGDDTDRPFQKSNNDWTYFANDCAYHFYKLKRGFNELINVWGSDHIGYIKRMESIVKVLSNEKEFLPYNARNDGIYNNSSKVFSIDSINI